MLTLNNRNTTDDWNAANTITDRVCDRINIILVGAPGIYYQLQAATMEGKANEGSWYPERYLPGEPSGGIFPLSLSRRCTGIRVRSAVAGAPANVTIEMIPAEQLGRAEV